VAYENKKKATTYKKFSPREYVAEWKTPTLVVHSELDYRLPITEGLSTFTALQRQGIPSRLLYFPDENHWILKHANSLKWNAEVLRWINQWTFNDKKVATAVPRRRILVKQDV
jgi:dipeptidyl aminopeptidase/acylaminoacyl peptidase